MTQSANVLVVEDREDWQAIICEEISTTGFRPYAVSNYEEAIDSVQTQSFKLAIVDPVLDRNNSFNRAGVSVIQKISQIRPDLPIIVITGSYTPDIKASLANIRPEAPVLFKESWNPAEFAKLVGQHLIDESLVAASSKSDAQMTVSLDSSLAPPPSEQAAGRPRVLVVENRQDWREILASVLESEGYFWRIARNAQEALLEMERESYHLVILDLKLQENELPTRSNEGWLLLDHLMEAHPKAKVMVVSGRASPSDVANLLTNYPVIGFVEKQNFNPQIVIDAVIEATKAPQLRIQTFGQFLLWRDDKTIDVWERPQAEMIVKLLLVRRARGGRTVTSDELITRLWPDADIRKGRKNLLPLISNARRTLEPDIEPRDSNFIVRSGNGYFFDVSRFVTWDLQELGRYFAEGKQFFRGENWEAAIASFEAGRALYKGDFLQENRYDDWAMGIRHDIANDFRDLLIYMADAYAALGHYAQAIEACEMALRKDPLQESIYRRLMRFHYCNGEKAQALKAYRDCLKLFEELFEENPTPATRQLHDAIANDEPVACLSEG